MNKITSLKVKAHAKINLNLTIKGRRADGYHDIDTIMRTVALCDTVRVTLRDDNLVGLSVIGEDIPLDGENTAIIAHNAFCDALGVKLGADICIDKAIPSGAGLGGGSADAAAVLCALNELCGFPLSAEKLRQTAETVGADVPFLITGGTARCVGIGEEITPIEISIPEFILIAMGNIPTSTKAAYDKFDENPDVAKNQKDELFYNVFEELTDLEDVKTLKTVMIDSGADAASMTGSGSAVYGLFSEKEKAQECCDILRRAGFWAVLTS
ncbi:MAG: 4-(cytidine 5'-diphospho)-2-C-methyl-D-erythritol kinase [Ruminococcus sp.]|jgi:4-diphosphocytidyl-2-C-methyl-D-erythritol kinase|nr:4-(cytidine 5'-diphospho)-2-C-methyl-D-erythritol kinase [Ruminococcus sp.]